MISHWDEAETDRAELGTKDPNDITYYPRSKKIFFRGVGLIARLDHLAYEVGGESTT